MTAFQRLMRRVRYGQPVIVVSGLPRSGTSMMMQMLAAGGIPILSDGVRTPDDSNPEGYYEFEPVKALEQGGDTAWVADARGRAVKVVSSLLRYLPDTSDYRILFMQRHLDEVIDSQDTMLARAGAAQDAAPGPTSGPAPSAVSHDEVRALYRAHLDQTRLLLRARPELVTLDVEHRRAVDDPLAVAREVEAFLGRSMDVARMAAAVRPALHRNRR